jgi:hypothetical protein
LSGYASAATVWTGPEVEFSKFGSDDESLVENQDRLSDTVWLTRGSDAGLFNIAQETEYQRFGDVSPAGTRWAFQGLNGNPESGVSAEIFEDLVFSDWTSALGIQQVQQNILDRPGVVHLVDDDIYFDILFLEWTSPRGDTAVRYVRTSPVPVPAAVWLMLSGLGVLGWFRRRTG